EKIKDSAPVKTTDKGTKMVSFGKSSQVSNSAACDTTLDMSVIEGNNADNADNMSSKADESLMELSFSNLSKAKPGATSSVTDASFLSKSFKQYRDSPGPTSKSTAKTMNSKTVSESSDDSELDVSVEMSNLSISE
ncbi:unnamed protein product, partial [Lymnaea stagnalis]